MTVLDGYSVRIEDGRCYDLKILELIYKRNLILGLTQENSIGNFVQDCLPYILNYYDLYYHYYVSSLL